MKRPLSAGFAPIWLPLAVGLAACGARTDLAIDSRQPSTDAGAQAPPRADADRPDGQARCSRLAQLDGPVRVFGEDGLNYVAPTVVARDGGFDVVAFQNNGAGAAAHATMARRLTVSRSAPSLELQPQQVLDGETHSVARAAASGGLLGTCQGTNGQGGRALTFQTHGGAYTLGGRVRRSESENFCYSVAGAGDRWAVFWRGENDAPWATTLAEFSSAGELLREPRALESTESGAQSTGYGRGLAWSVQFGSAVRVEFSSDASESTLVVEPVGSRRSPGMIAPLPWRDDGVAVLWEESLDSGGMALRLSTVSDEPELIDSQQLPPIFTAGVIPAIAASAEHLVVAGAAYDEFGAPSGQIHVALVGSDGAMAAEPAQVPFERGHLNDHKDLSIAADGDHVLLVWAVRPDAERPGVWAALLGCED